MQIQIPQKGMMILLHHTFFHLIEFQSKISVFDLDLPIRL